jgi:molecular chaperone DnaJ
MRRDYYAVLGIAATVGPREIRQAYRRLARQYSPDVNLWDEEARSLFDEIAEAYRVLSDPSARVIYDRFGHQLAGGAIDPSRRGDDVHTSIELSFGDAARGVQCALEIQRFSPCEDCGARGHDGRGAPCARCAGRGVHRSVDSVPVTIPAGVDSGSQVCVPHEGSTAPFGGARGDLIVSMRVREHPLFKRKGDTVHCEVVVSVWEAIRGARVRVPTPSGEAFLVVPPGTTGGRRHGRSVRDDPRRDAHRARRADPRARASAGAADAAGPAGGPRALRGRRRMTDRTKPLYMIGVVAEMLGVHPQTLRFYEKKGLLRPSRTVGRTRMYSADDVEELARLLRLTRDLGVNLAGVEVIIRMRRRMVDMQKQIEDLLAYLRDSGLEVKDSEGGTPREALVRAASGQLQPVDLF